MLGLELQGRVEVHVLALEIHAVFGLGIAADPFLGGFEPNAVEGIPGEGEVAVGVGRLPGRAGSSPAGFVRKG